MRANDRSVSFVRCCGPLFFRKRLCRIGSVTCGSQTLHIFFRELQEALTARENLLEREETIRLEVEASERMMQMCADSSESASETEDVDGAGACCRIFLTRDT